MPVCMYRATGNEVRYIHTTLACNERAHAHRPVAANPHATPPGVDSATRESSSGIYFRYVGKKSRSSSVCTQSLSISSSSVPGNQAPLAVRRPGSTHVSMRSRTGWCALLALSAAPLPPSPLRLPCMTPLTRTALQPDMPRPQDPLRRAQARVRPVHQGQAGLCAGFRCCLPPSTECVVKWRRGHARESAEPGVAQSEELLCLPPDFLG